MSENFKIELFILYEKVLYSKQFGVKIIIICENLAKFESMMSNKGIPRKTH